MQRDVFWVGIHVLHEVSRYGVAGEAGLSTQLLKAAVDFARNKGAHIIEGYPHNQTHATA